MKVRSHTITTKFIVPSSADWNTSATDALFLLALKTLLFKGEEAVPGQTDPLHYNYDS